MECKVFESVSDSYSRVLLLRVLPERAGSYPVFTKAAGDGRDTGSAFMVGTHDDIGGHILPVRSDVLSTYGSGIPDCDRSVNIYGRLLLVEPVKVYVRKLGHVCAERQSRKSLRVFTGSGGIFGMSDDRGSLEGGRSAGGEKGELSVIGKVIAYQSYDREILFG